MEHVFEQGIAKTQKLKYSDWQTLREVRTREELVDFYRSNADFFMEFLERIISHRKTQDIFERGRIRDPSEFDFLCEATKSAIFRAGGTNIIEWGAWTAEGESLSYRRLSQSRTVCVDIYGTNAEVPVGYAVQLPSPLYHDLAAATRKIHEAIREEVSGVKLLTRVDFVIVSPDKAYIVDIGESNTTLGLTDSLAVYAGWQNPSILPKYIKKVLAEQRRLVPNFDRVVIVAEDDKMREECIKTLK